MKKISLCNYENLPKWVDTDCLSNNGSGKESAAYLVIEDGDYKAIHSDAMEREDTSFHRDLSWIKEELERLLNP